MGNISKNHKSHVNRLDSTKLAVKRKPRETLSHTHLLLFLQLSIPLNITPELRILTILTRKNYVNFGQAEFLYPKTKKLGGSVVLGSYLY